MASPGATPQPSSAPTPEGIPVGSVLSGRYRIESLLGEGGMGAVYLAEHTLMRKRLAVKVLHSEMGRMPEVVARFEREAMAAAHIEHPNVAAATDFGKLEDGSFFLVLEYIEGTSLRDQVSAGPLELARALHIARQIALALARAHSLGIVHRDLKPENVMLVDRDGDKDFVKVLDFGIAKVPVGALTNDANGQPGKALTQVGMVYGTPEYMAPEQALGQEVDLRADLYALGVMLYEMLCGVRPFEAESKVTLLGMQVTMSPPKLGTRLPGLVVPASVEAIVTRLLAKEAAERFEGARELIDAIDQAMIDEGIVPPPSQMRGSLGSSPSSVRLRAATAAGAPPPAPPASIAPEARSTVNELPPSAEVAGGSALDLLKAKLPPSLRELPIVPLIAGAGALVLVLMVVLVVALRGKGPAVQPTADAGPLRGTLGDDAKPASTAGEAAIAAAVASGAPALEELAAKFGSDAAVLRALVRAYVPQKRHADAMKAVGKLLSIDDKAAADPEIASAIQQAAQGSPEGADLAFALLEGPLGAKGVDLLYELATAKGVAPKTVQRINQSLAKPEVRAHATPAALVTIELRAAAGCEAKKAVVPRAGETGDERTLALLRPLGANRGCGFLQMRDCWPCLHRDGSLASAISAIEARGGGK